MNSCYNDKFFHEKWGGLGRPSRPASDGLLLELSIILHCLQYHLVHSVIYTFRMSV